MKSEILNIIKGHAMNDKVKKINNHINDYSNIELMYKKIEGEELNRNPYDSITNYPMRECRYTVSIIIPSWNSIDTLRYTLKTIEYTDICKKHNSKLEVVVIDDGSDDETEKFIETHIFAFTILYIRQKHMGRPQGINTAIRKSKGDIIVFCDSDILLYPYTIDELVKRQQCALNSAIFFGFREDIEYENIPFFDLENFLRNRVPGILRDNRFTFDYDGYWGNNMLLETNLLRNRNGYKNLWVSFGEKSVDDCWQLYRMVYGFLFSVSKENYYKVKGFDECMIGWGFDDTAFVAKCIVEGVSIIPVPSSICLHIRHELRTPNQWEEGRLNQKRLNERLNNDSFDDNLAYDLSERIILEKEYPYTTEDSLEYMRPQIDLSEIQKANLFYNICELERAIAIYRKYIKELTIEEIEHYFDAIIRLYDYQEFIYLRSLVNISEFYYGSLAANFFEDRGWETPQNRFLYKSYCFKTGEKDHIKRADLYAAERQWYLALRDYYGAVICGSKISKEKCELCKKEIWRSYDIHN